LNRHTLVSRQAVQRTSWDRLRWFSPHSPGNHQPDNQWYDWLMNPSSLTRRLQLVSHNRFRVEQLSQHIVKPALNEASLLKLRSQQYVLVRQVLLYGGDQPWVFARTVIPLTTLNEGNRHLLKLGNRSLGSVLFKYPHIRRAPIEICHADPDKAFFTDFVWGRRSIFEIHQSPLLVTELFLDTFCQSQQLKPLMAK